MNDYCERFYFAKDMNGDLLFSISDVWLIIKFFWLLPAKVVMSIVENLPGWAPFFEIGCSTGESWGGGIFSFFAWIIALGFVGISLERLL